MDYKDWSSKLEEVLERVDKDTLYDFITAYARTHEDFALLLVNEFWQAEKDDYRSMVQQCLMHPVTSSWTFGRLHKKTEPHLSMKLR